MIAYPPLFAGAVHETETWPGVVVAETLIDAGAADADAGVAATVT